MYDLSFIDISIIVSYLIICLVVGYRKAARVKTLRQFALPTRIVPVPMLMAVIFASAIGSGSILGTTEKIYTLGLVFVITELIKPLQWLILAKILVPNIEQFRDCISISQVMYKLYGSAGRWVTNVVAVIAGIGVVAAQASALGYVLHYLLGVQVIWGILTGYIVLTTYSMLGGIQAIIPTEIFKAVIFFFIIPISFLVVSIQSGGLGTVIGVLPDEYLKLNINFDNILLFISLIFFALLPGIDSPLMQRYLMAKDSAHLKQTFIGLACMSLPFYILISAIAYIVRAYAPGVPANEAFLYYIANFLPVAVKGLMITGLMAIIMAMAEAWLNATSVIIVNDMINVWFPKLRHKSQKAILRLTVIILSASSIWIAMQHKDLLELIWMVGSFWYPVVLIPIFAGFLGFRTSSSAFIASVICGMFAVIAGRLTIGDFSTITLSLGIIASAIGLFGAHYFMVTTKSNEVIINAIILTLSDWVKIRVAKINGILTEIKEDIMLLLTDKPRANQIEVGRFATFICAYYIISLLNISSHYNHMIYGYLLAGGYALTLSLVFREAIFPKWFIKRYMYLYWYLVLIFCLPFSASYIAFAAQRDVFWLVNSIVCGFSLLVFVNVVHFLILSFIGVAFGLVLFEFTKHDLTMAETGIYNVSYIYALLVGVSLFFFRRKEKEHLKVTKVIQGFSSKVAHDIRSPVASLVMSAEYVKGVLNNIDKAKKIDGNRCHFDLDKDDFILMKEVSISLYDFSLQAVSSIDKLLFALKTNIRHSDEDSYSIKDVIREALREYGITNNFAEKVELIVIRDFPFYGSLRQFKQVIFNLLNNAHQYGGSEVQVKITISDNKVEVEDNGKGMSKEMISSIFRKFFNSHGKGVGLALCRLVMKNIGGNIKCKSIIGKSTVFTMIFPASNPQQNKA